MSEETSPIVVTLKGGRDYDAPWLVIRGNNPAQVAEMLRNLGDLPEVVAQQASLFAGTVSAGPVIQQPEQSPAAWGAIQPGQGFQPAQQGQQWSQPAQQAAPPPQQGPQLHPEGKSCPVDNKTLIYKEVFSRAKNKTFRFWTCPDQRSRDDGHASEFAD